MFILLENTKLEKKNEKFVFFLTHLLLASDIQIFLSILNSQFY